MMRYLRRLFINANTLLTAFTLFRLRGGNLPYFQYVYPTLLTLLVLGVFNEWGSLFITVDVEKVVASATTLMGVLVGFYIAALAAVTSFPNDNLDNPMAGRSTMLREKCGRGTEEVSRRRFLSILLGYCAFLSILIFLTGSISTAISLKPQYQGGIAEALTAAYWAIYTWMISSLSTITLLCLHYLIDRMHRD
ncbi:hypothetical protein [Sulfitobacter sp.]|uniref:hypothetical protein n=1 Tax=Sulfitobacter sp. TaxID=1903071 RepID=UPI002623B8E1|nr:hypothetical protein [Sulfitobacter sp.]